jgi:hypothetical protein
MRNFRPPLERLHDANPDYADELRDLTSQLEYQATSSFEAKNLAAELASYCSDPRSTKADDFRTMACL